MKIICRFLMITLLFLISGNSLAQDTVYVNGQMRVTGKNSSVTGEESYSPLVKNDYMLEVGYGFPYLAEYETELGNSKYSPNAQTTNHIIGKLDYVVNEEISLGIDATYSQKTWNYTSSYYDINTGNSHDTSYSASVRKFRLVLKASYHFNISDRIDTYTSAGVGYKSIKVKTGSSKEFTGQALIPISVRSSVGCRFFINPTLAAHVEIGLGGPIMQFGLTLKFHDDYEKPDPDKPKKKKKKR
jgi:opacity protein-like surface antigen